jgi:hypothetical protein
MTSPIMTEMKREILTDSGSKLNVLGKTIIDIDINGYVCLNFGNLLPFLSTIVSLLAGILAGFNVAS